jgi:hypothetical protein
LHQPKLPVLFSIFKINDPYRLIALLLIAIGIKLPFMLGGCSSPDMEYWLLLGEAVDNTTMYMGVLDNLAPLSAGVYWLIVFITGKSVLTLHILGLLLLLLQAIIFNSLAIRNKVYEQNTYLPAFVYVIIGSIQYELSVFSPAQLGMTFILLALSELLAHVEFRAKRDEQIMSIGLLVGLASLFYLPLFLFLPIILLVLIIFTNTLSRRYAILIISAFMPLSVALAYYWIMHSTTSYFFAHFIIPTVSFGLENPFTHLSSIVVFIPLVLLFIAGFTTMHKQRRLNNYQNRLAQLFFVFSVLLFGIPLLTIIDKISVALLYLPVLAFISSHLFYLIRKPITDLTVSLIFIGAILFMAFQTEFQITPWPGKTSTRAQVVQELGELIKEKKIWVLGEHKELYTYGSIGTSFFDWSLSRPFLDNLNYYDNLVFIRQSLDLFEPDVILDYDQRWREIVNHIPTLENEYEQIRPFVWVRK